MTRPIDDLALLQRVREGDPEARRELAERLRCVPRILKVINRRRGDLLSAHDLEDLSQDTVLKILGKLEAFPGHATLEAWTYRFCFLELMNRLRRQARMVTRVTSGLEEDLEADGPAQPHLDAGELEQWLARMQQAESEVIRLRLFEHREFTDIAVQLDAPLATVRSRYYRGIAWLQERLGALQEDRA